MTTLPAQKSELFLSNEQLLALLTTSSCVVYPEYGRAPFTLPNCTPDLVVRDISATMLGSTISGTWPSSSSVSVKREMDKGFAESDPMFAPQPHIPILPKPRPKRPPLDDKIKVRETKESIAEDSPDYEIDITIRPRDCKETPNCFVDRADSKREVDGASTEFNESEWMQEELLLRSSMCQKMDPNGCIEWWYPNADGRMPWRKKLERSKADGSGSIHPDVIRRSELKDSEAAKEDLPHSVHNSGPHFICILYDQNGICSYGYYNWDRYVVRRSDLDELEFTPPGQRCFARYQNGTCLYWASDVLELDLQDSDYPTFDRITAGDPGELRPSGVIHASYPFNALKMENVEKECGTKRSGVFNLTNG